MGICYVRSIFINGLIDVLYFFLLESHLNFKCFGVEYSDRILKKNLPFIYRFNYYTNFVRWNNKYFYLPVAVMKWLKSLFFQCQFINYYITSFVITFHLLFTNNSCKLNYNYRLVSFEANHKHLIFQKLWIHNF